MRVAVLLVSSAACGMAPSVVCPTLVQAQQASPARAPAQAGRAAEQTSASGQGQNIAIADALFVAARGLMEAERYPEACAKFAESYRLDPASGTLLNLAVCHEHEGKLASAWGEFREALHEAESARRADRAQLAREHADALGPQLPYLTVEVPVAARVRGLEIVRNGVPTLEAAWDEELPVDPGLVRIEVRAPGYRTETREVTIAPRQHLTVRVPALAPTPAADPTPAVVEREETELVRAEPASTSTGPSPSDEPLAPSRRRRAGLGLIAAGALTTSVGITAGVMTLHERGQSDDACPKFDGERRCTQAGVDAMKSARKWALVSDLGLGLGVVGIAAGLYVLLSTPRAARTDRTHALRSPPRDAPHGARSRWSWDFAAGPRGVRGVVARAF